MRRMLVRVALVAAVIVAAEAALVAVSLPAQPLDVRSLGIAMTATGAFILAGGFLALVGPTTHASSFSIGPLRGGVVGGSQGILLSSGTRSLWDFSRSPGLRAEPSQVYSVIGTGAVLFVLGLLLASI